ncbi:ABC transporter substrate-binding protein [Ohessyouella blattaphilus]|uniref:Extracellular solute-binding protein n=1 Tax=Ohessyouella blattaphilus TaxID=2949333 RepID=A0ABT1EL86_9FIRM|nr:extracellular solute-binding protein [Ohessyouella blattaphilus]MCP1110547.1 extracellular solute-binding protein [Ohessyouella blattaphilus]MCR8563941.1 extracellular solute-binding protein [Ohessyouella blattaphilus]MDL2249455.1 extracellular solute-binding protein [Lachnospiraceae bacterium OttesenSCG-928-J05]
MKKRLLATLLVMVVTATVILTGCGNGGTDSSKSSSDTLTVMCVGTEADTYLGSYKQIAEEFSKENEFGVEVKIDFYENEQYKTKLTTLMASNAVPDVFFTWELSYLQPFVEGGKVADMTPYLEEDTEWRDQFSDGTLELLAYDGKNYGIPTQKSLCVMFYNKKIFADNGLSVPTTYKEFLQVCKTLKENGITPMTMCGTDAWIPAQFVQQIAGGMAGDQLFNDICEGKEQWNNETHVKAAEEVKKMADAGYFQDGYIGMGPEEARDLIMNGTAAMYFMGAWEADNIQNSDLGEDAGAFVLPAYDEQYNNISVGSVDTSFCVSENSKNKDAAVAFIKYWSSLEKEEMLLYDVGRIPADNFELDESKLTPLMTEILNISNSQVGLTPWWDRQFGAGEGVEFNNTCVSILGGEDASTAFDALQQFAEDNANR